MLSQHKCEISLPKLKALIVDQAKDGHPSIERMAKRLGVSIRSLQRDLERQGTSYSEVVDSARYEAAQNLLRRSRFRVCDVAGELGYRDPSSFSRAFARWSGTTPRRFRATLRERRAAGKK